MEAFGLCMYSCLYSVGLQGVWIDFSYFKSSHSFFHTITCMTKHGTLRISSQAHEVINRARGPRPFPSIMKPAPLLRSNSSPQSNNSSHSRRSSKHSNSNLSSNFFHFPNHLHHHLGHGHKHDSAAAGGGEQAQGRRRGSLIQKLNPQLHNVEEFSNNQSHQSPPVTQCSSVKQSKDMGSGRFRPSSTANPHSDAIRRRLATEFVDIHPSITSGPARIHISIPYACLHIAL